MDMDEIDQAREKIWDFIFQNGEQSVEELASQLGLSVEQVVECVNDDWFVVDDQKVSIATQST